MFSCIVLFAVFALCEGQLPEPEEEVYVLYFDSPVNVCDDAVSKTFADMSAVEMIRFNESVSIMTGSFTFLKEMTACTLVEIIVEKTTNGRTEVMMTHEICDICGEINESGDYYKYLKYFCLPDKCPFPKGTYEINNFMMDTEDLPCNRANEASYQVTLNFFSKADCECDKDNREFIGCLKFGMVIALL